MKDDSDALDFVTRNPKLAALTNRLPKPVRHEQVDEEESESCPAFGYVRGLDKRALAVEFRFRDGNSDWLSYSLLGSWRFNPSIGLLMKFSGGDVLTCVLIRGSNLDSVLPDREINLTDRGLQRHRILWIREMEKEELRRAGSTEPTIDRIDIAEFETNEEMRDWLKKNAPSFIRGNSQ